MAQYDDPTGEEPMRLLAPQIPNVPIPSDRVGDY
jgi:hypothetical protein